MKFKIGDIVRTKHMGPNYVYQRGPSDIIYRYAFVSNENKTAKILDKCEKNNTYYIQIENDNSFWWYDEQWLEM